MLKRIKIDNIKEVVEILINKGIIDEHVANAIKYSESEGENILIDTNSILWTPTYFFGNLISSCDDLKFEYSEDGCYLLVNEYQLPTP